MLDPLRRLLVAVGSPQSLPSPAHVDLKPCPRPGGLGFFTEPFLGLGPFLQSPFWGWGLLTEPFLGFGPFYRALLGVKGLCLLISGKDLKGFGLRIVQEQEFGGLKDAFGVYRVLMK